MIGRFKNKIAGKIQNILRAAVRKEIENAMPVIVQLIEFQNSANEDRQSFYDHTKDPLGSIDFYKDLKDRLLSAGVPVEPVDIDIHNFEQWLNDFHELRRHYEKMGNVFIEKCLEHYLAYRHLNISSDDVYIDIAAAGSPWAEILNSHKGAKAYRLDLSFPNGINGIDIGADSGDTKLPDGFASVLSLQCAYECFMGDADIRFIKEGVRILNSNGRYGIIPLYLEDTYFVATSPYVIQQNIKIESEAKKIWRDDEYKAPFSRHYSPESFKKRIYSAIPKSMSGKVLYFRNLKDVMNHFPEQRIYCFFMFVCEKKKSTCR